jgi:Transposase DDE domain
VGYHRFFNNGKVKPELIMEAHFNYVSQRTKGRNLICIQDTSEYNYQHHYRLIKEGELGPISDDVSLGMKVHPMLVVDQHDNFTYGFSSFEIINQAGKQTTRHQRNYKHLDIEQKQSYRWLSAIEQTKKRLCHAQSITVVADRESDIYQLWSRIPDERTHLVIRTSFMRRFSDEQQNRIKHDTPLQVLGVRTVFIPGRLGKVDKARDAQLEISFQKAYTLKPLNLSCHGQSDPHQVPVNIVAVKEIVPSGVTVKEPIEWFLLTDLPIETLADALGIIDIYKSRWHLEQIFRLTKQKGFNLEESQLQRAAPLKNLMAFVFIAASKIYQMVLARDNEKRMGSDLFEADELMALEKLNTQLEGRTERSKNKNKPQSLAFYLWIIARLGNWKPEDKSPPGPITFKRGWETFLSALKIHKIIISP